MTVVSTNKDSPRTAHLEALAFDVEVVRRDFPILTQKINGKPLAYLDNAATAQKPRSVIDAITHYYEHDNANIHRGVHALSVRATQAYEKARATSHRFVGAERLEEIVFVRSATEGINLVAQSYGRSVVGEGDEIILTQMEHHSNIVPWQMLCEQTGGVLRVVPLDDRGDLCLDEYERLLTPRTKIVALAHVSNALGTINPVGQMTAMAHQHGAKVLIDGAQAAPHLRIDVRTLDSDFYVLSSHKLFGPTGVGVLHAKHDILKSLPPYQGGGEMIKSVTFEKTTYNDIPHKFEAGTPNIAGTIGLGAAMDYVNTLGWERIEVYERDLLAYATEALSAIPEVRLIGTAQEKAAVLSFSIEGIHAHDVGTILDQEGIAVRTGHHCAQPVMDRFGVPATTRASFAFYNTRGEIDALVSGVRKVIEVFR
jgi:cysteine desulfurase/selenocysteine lyase